MRTGGCPAGALSLTDEGAPGFVYITGETEDVVRKRLAPHTTPSIMEPRELWGRSFLCPEPPSVQCGFSAHTQPALSTASHCPHPFTLLLN